MAIGEYCVKTSEPGTAMRGAKVLVHHYFVPP